MSEQGYQWSEGAAGPVLNADNADHFNLLALFGLDETEASSWWGQGLCAQSDPDAFFPEKGGSTREAKKVCRSCEVRAECLEYALEHDERFGIWGGLSERERRTITRQRRREPAQVDEKTCAKCAVTKPVTEFHRRTRSGYEHRCKACRHEASVEAWQRKKAS